MKTSADLQKEMELTTIQPGSKLWDINLNFSLLCYGSIVVNSTIFFESFIKDDSSILCPITDTMKCGGNCNICCRLSLAEHCLSHGLGDPASFLQGELQLVKNFFTKMEFVAGCMRVVGGL